MHWVDEVYWNNPLRDWILAFGVALGVGLGLRLMLAFLTTRLQRLTERTTNRLDDAVLESLGRTHLLTLLAIGVSFAVSMVQLPAAVVTVLHRATFTIVLVQTGVWIAHAAKYWLEHYRTRKLDADRATATAVGAISFVVQMIIWTMVLLVVLSNMGVNITALITGLGVGGIAVALALQKVFSDLFASLSIVFDKPFVIGDFLIVDDLLGSVEHVGLKTTRLRSLSGEQLVFSNSDLLDSRLRNYGRMYERRVVFNIGVTYQTDQEQLKMIPGVIREAIEAEDETRFDRSNFAKYGDFSLQFESVYYVLAPDYNLYMDIQERVNLRIRESFLAEGIEFAYPTQTLLISR